MFGIHMTASGVGSVFNSAFFSPLVHLHTSLSYERECKRKVSVLGLSSTHGARHLPQL